MQKIVVLILLMFLFSFSAMAQSGGDERDRSKLLTPEDQQIIENFQKNLDPTQTYTKADCYFECRMREEPIDFCWKQCTTNPFWPFRN